jgi:GDP-L-fucose synthase
MNKDNAILILGAGGMVGSALIKALKEQGHTNILGPRRSELDLLCQQDVLNYFETNKPAYVIDAAAKVGGIHANNNYRADFIWQNLAIQNNVFEASYKNNVEKFLFLGSSCIYPKSCEIPIKEESLLSSPLEQTNEPYAIAKIAGLKMAESFRRQYGLNFFSVMPTNLYGENDNFHPENSHVIPGLIERMDRAIKENWDVFPVWGSGKPRREFLYVGDLAEACLYLMNFEGELPYWLNVGTGEDIEIGLLATKIAELMGYQGQIEFDTSKPDGTFRKVLDVSKINDLGWKHKVALDDGLKKSIDFFRETAEVRRS